MNTPHVYGTNAEDYRLAREQRAATSAYARQSDLRFLLSRVLELRPRRRPQSTMLVSMGDECKAGRHVEHIGTTARQGYVRFVTCVRGCGFYAIRKGSW